MATITLPSSPAFRSVTPMRRKSTTMSMSPYNFTQQVYSWSGKLKVVEFELPPMSTADATTWLTFLDDLEGHTNTFNIDLTDYYPDEPSASSVAMRMAEPDHGWSVDVLTNFGVSFTALEAK